MVVYNSDITTGRRNRFAQHSSLLNAIANRRLGFNNAFTQGKNTLDVEKPTWMRNVTNADASRGMGYSSGHAQNIQGVNDQYSQGIADLESERDTGLADLDYSEGTENANYEYDVADFDAQQAAFDTSQREAAAAYGVPGKPAKKAVAKKTAAPRTPPKPPVKKVVKKAAPPKPPAKQAPAKKVAKKK